MFKGKWNSFLSGFLCAAVLLSCTAGVLAASGTVSFNSVGLKANGKTLFSQDQELTNDAGRSIPSSIVYQDEAGGGTTYLPLAYVARLLDTPVGWDGKTGTVLLGRTFTGGFQIGLGSEETSSLDQMPTNSAGSQIAPFTEIEPRLPQEDEPQSLPISHTVYRSVDGYEDTFGVNRANGKYVSVTVTNHNDFPLLFRLGRSYNLDQKTVSTQIPAGQTVTRTVEVGESDLLVSNPSLLVFVGSNGQWSEIDIEIEAVQFGQGSFPYQH